MTAIPARNTEDEESYGMSAELGLGINKELGIQRRIIPIYLHIQP
jgi:hypothetical protein